MASDPSLAEAQAAVNRASRSAAQDPNRPIFHAMCPGNWMNDPNGPILVGDEVHLFYQHHPFKADFDDFALRRVRTGPPGPPELTE